MAAQQGVAYDSTAPQGDDTTDTAKNGTHAKTLSGVTVTAQGTTGYVADNDGAATKTDTPIIETPQSISVVTRQQMDDQQPQSLNEALRYSPGVVPETQGTSSNFWSGSSLQLRGFTAAVYQDGLQDDATSNDLLDPYFYQSVEVLSGPASVLYGQGSPGGIVNITSKMPTATPLHEVTFGIGNYDRYQAGFDFSGPLDQSGQLLYRLTGVGATQDTQTSWIKRKRLAIAPAVTWRPNENTSLTLLTNYTYNPAIGDYSSVPASGTVLWNPKGKISSSFSPGDPNFNRTEQRISMVGYQFQHRFNDIWEFQQNLRYTDNRNQDNMIWPLGLEPDDETLDRYAWVRDERSRSFLIDNRLKAQFDLGPLQNTVLMGVQYSHVIEDWAWGANMNLPPINVFNPVYGVPIQGPDPSELSTEKNWAKQTGIYLQDQINLGRWRFLLGVRQDWVDEKQTGNSASLNLPNEPDDKLTWRTGVVYLFDNGLAPYASYSTSFQPQFGDITANGTAAVPTTGQQYEVGLKYQPVNSNSLLTLAAYNLTEQNVPETDPLNPGFIVQVGEIRSRGVELSDRTSLTDNLNLIASYTFTDSSYVRSDLTGVGVNGVTAAVQGKYQYGVPRQSASLWADYTLHSSLLHGLGFSAGVRYVGSTYGDNVNSFKVPAFTLLDAAVRYDVGAMDPALHGLKLQLNIANLLDKYYVSGCTSDTQCNFGVRRTIYASATYDW
ncbi:TonB-dependent siderophore receptor [Dyella caseinilytica]|uniref:TonB-dependent siderophore receptor n=1 Tax=Dyella caseinilytica TaxID=1849581 RepID=A0ABX7GQ29_9GAMM|nr:TonB-dependent siderophore receptor [Dyella caseinilytica]QRN52525.1 TonB-dependent siderophore receptor [Dyella caseinilytica]GGA06763.1 ligand-gated channel [Dyella caseinilytica]